MNYEELLAAYDDLKKENALLKSEIRELRGKSNEPQSLLFVPEVNTPSRPAITFLSKIHINSHPKEKIELFMSLFRGRSDVFAKRWQSAKTGTGGYQPACANEWRDGICPKPKIKCADCSNRKFQPLTEAVIEAHLRGEDKLCRDVIGIYPMLENETCYFIVIDFDKENWQVDIRAFRSLCTEKNITLAVERSRSGNGAHAWFFFVEPINAVTARKFASSLLTNAMNKRHEIGFTSYDRLIPGQDTMPKGGFGNLVALPLQGQARRHNNSLFIDEIFEPYKDQWSYLSSIKKFSLAEIEMHTKELCGCQELGTLARTDEDEKPWEKAKPEKELSQADFPNIVNIVRADMLRIEKAGISQVALNRIKRLAAFKNPEFYKAQAMRLSTYKIERVISSLDETPKYIGIPRGCEMALTELLSGSFVKFFVDDRTNPGRKIKVEFNGELTDEQKPAATALMKYDIGVLSATTVFGKTVIGANIIASKKANTLVLVHTQALLTQWKKALEQFLIIAETLPAQEKKKGRKRIISTIGQIGAGTNRLSGIVDIAVMQSLVNNGEVKELVKDYGMVIVDECHHVSAVTLEKILKNTTAKYVYGLTATPARQDGHHPLIFMQCGPIRYKVDARIQASKRSFEHYVIPKFTTLKKPLSYGEKEWAITKIYADVAGNEVRNRQIADDVVKCVENGRSPIILTGRSAHVAALADMLKERCGNVLTLVGSVSQKEKKETMKRLNDISKDEPLVIVAIGKYVGEGFDCPRLDTLFLAMPVAWKGTIAQYAGRLHRQYEGKNEVLIYDYVDIHVPVLERMYHKRVKGYAQIGYKAKAENAPPEKTNVIFDEKSFQPFFSNDLASAAKEIIIVSPFLRMARVKQMMQFLAPALMNGATATVVTRPSEDYKEEFGKIAADVSRYLSDANIKVVCKSKIHQKYAVIDRRIVWYGSINFLSFGFGEESVMRLESYEIADELIGAL